MFIPGFEKSLRGICSGIQAKKWNHMALQVQFSSSMGHLKLVGHLGNHCKGVYWRIRGKWLFLSGSPQDKVEGTLEYSKHMSVGYEMYSPTDGLRHTYDNISCRYWRFI